jgi:hypothetical protein
MATVTTPRTFKLTKPDLMEGDDIASFQTTLSDRFDAWSINKHVSSDGCYGPATQAAAREVCIGLGIDPGAAMRHGVVPDLRRKIRDPDRRTDAEVARSLGEAAKRLRADLRKQFADIGGVIVMAGANNAGEPLTRTTLEYVARMAHRLGMTLKINCGTNHSKMTANGNPSDHVGGHAADLGMGYNGGTNDGPLGDRIAAAALMEAGLSSGQAMSLAKGGGIHNVNHGGQRIQVIWKAVGHHDHVHVGLKPI